MSGWSDTYDADRVVHEAEIEECIYCIEYDEPYDCTDKLDRNVDDSNSLSVSVNTDG